MIAPLTWLDVLRASCAAMEEAVADPGTRAERLAAAVPWCEGVDVAETLRHVGVVHRVVRRWVVDGRRPRGGVDPPPDADPVAWFAEGWPPLLEALSSRDPSTQTSTWCTYDTTAGFWWRRMAHEAAVHAIDVFDAVGHSWPVPEEFAADGVDEALRLWLGVALGTAVGGRGRVVRIVAPQRFWTVGLNATNVEVTTLSVPPDATVGAGAEALYRWVWGRAADDAVTVDGDPAAVASLRSALARAMQ
jgi:uncharacterized protein (TIGR03083 family)